MALNPEEICAAVHGLMSSPPLFARPAEVPIGDGLYFFYEHGETSPHAPDGRMVRIGNHPRSDGTLVRRLRAHYSGGKNGSVFPYEAEMKGRVATMWRDTGLTDVIAELVRVSRARRVFGFFAGPARWSGAHAKYRYFFTEGVKAAASSGAELDTAACFHRAAGRGTGAITGALGRALLHGLSAGFSARILDEYAAGRADGNVIVKSEMLVDTAQGRRSAR